MSEGKFTYPFRYTPTPEVVRAAEDMIDRIDASARLRELFAEGKMLGVLETDKGFLYAFSGI